MSVPFRAPVRVAIRVTSRVTMRSLGLGLRGLECRVLGFGLYKASTLKPKS